MSSVEPRDASGWTDKERAFVEHYLVCWNGAEAARQAKYSARCARQIAHRLLTKAYIRAEIEKRLAEACMGPNEVLARLSDIASNSLEDCLTLRGKKWMIDLPKAKRLGKLHWIKSVKATRYGPEVELYSAKEALDTLARRHKLLTDRVEGAVEVILTVKRDASRTDSPPDPAAPAAAADQGQPGEAEDRAGGAPLG